MDDELVWHYTDAFGLLSILRSHTLWATSSRFLNDSSEVTAGWEVLRAELERRAETDDVYRLMLEAAGETLHETGQSGADFFVLSAAQHWDLLAMWRNYGGRGESYAIGLQRSAPLAALVDEEIEPADRNDDDGADAGADGLPAALPQVRQRTWSPIRYGRGGQQPLLDAVFATLDESIGWFREGLAAERDSEALLAGAMNLLDDIEQVLLTTKHEGFVDEREIRHSTVVYRGVRPDSSLARFGGGGPRPQRPLPAGLVQYRATPYGLAPYVRITGSSDGRATTATPTRLPIRALAVSPSPSSTASQLTLRDLLASLGYPEMPIHTSTIPFRE